MNLPNKLTLLRVAMIPVFVILAVHETLWTQLGAAAVFAAACLTDYLDGHIARSQNIVTNFGKFADPIADKILVMAALVVLVEQGRMPAWVCIVMLAREFAISGFRLVAVTSGKVIAAGKLGKLKTVTQMVSVIMLFLLVPVRGAPRCKNSGFRQSGRETESVCAARSAASASGRRPFRLVAVSLDGTPATLACAYSGGRYLTVTCSGFGVLSSIGFLGRTRWSG